jgi:hypothetical protein
MAWTAPRDWTGISDDIVTAAMLNVDVRDNLLFVGGTSDVTTGHTHTGAAGMGAASMSGLTLTALVNLTFTDEGAPDAAGELQRHGNDLKWYGSSVVNLTAADASAGTASLRSLGTTSVKAAAGNHSHVPGTPNQLVGDATASLNTDSESNIVSGTIVVQNATSEALAVFATVLLADGSGNTYTIRLKYSGPSSGTIDTIAGLGVASTDIHPLPNASGDAGLISPAGAGTYTIVATVERTDGTSLFNARATIFAREVGA